MDDTFPPTDDPSVSTLLDRMLADAPLAIALVDPDARVLRANDLFADAAAAAGPETRAPLEGRSLDQLLPRLADQIRPVLDEVLREMRPVWRVELVEPGATGEAVVDPASASPAVPVGEAGSGRAWELSAYPVRLGDGSLLGVGLFLADVTAERRVTTALTETLAWLELSQSIGGMGSWNWELDRNRVEWSGALEDLLGLPRGGFGRTAEHFLALVHDEDRAGVVAELTAAVEQRRGYHQTVRMLRADGEVCWAEIRGELRNGPDGRPTHMIGVAADVTERLLVEDMRRRLLEREHESRLVAERARERLGFLAEVSSALATTLDPVETFALVARQLVPRLADWCLVDAVDEDGGLAQVALAHVEAVDPDDVVESRRRRLAAGGDGLWSVRRTVRTGVAELVDPIEATDLDLAASDPEHGALLGRLAPRSAITAPLLARGRVLGGITLVTRVGRRLTTDDLALVEDLASRAAMAVDNALLFESQREVARTLQESLLPPALPRLPGVEVAARYRVAESGTDIGGDFYDLFELAGGDWGVVVGDVCGKGTRAAAITGLFRHSLRAAAVREVSPGQVLATTNEAILDQIDDTRFCTAVFARLIPPGRAGLPVHLRVASGGHPRPLVLRANGSVEPVPVAGTLLGVVPDPNLSDVTVQLDPGDSIVLFTDGVTEARRDDAFFGEEGLVAALRGRGGLSADALAGMVEASLDRYRGHGATDDTVLLVVRAAPAA